MLKLCKILDGGGLDLISIIMLISFFVSTVVSVLTLKKKNKRWLALLIALGLNTLILLVATWILYSINDEAKMFGIGQTNLYELIFSIPIISCINLIILQFMRSRWHKRKNETQWQNAWKLQTSSVLGEKNVNNNVNINGN